MKTKKELLGKGKAPNILETPRYPSRCWHAISFSGIASACDAELQRELQRTLRMKTAPVNKLLKAMACRSILATNMKDKINPRSRVAPQPVARSVYLLARCISVWAGSWLTAMALLAQDSSFTDANWVSMGEGIPGSDSSVLAAVVDGSGNLYIGGYFSVA